ncbi:50S ribosomal protein L25/general stress protein Ctc [Paucibacter sp. DJ1R-11]|uniref:50S ribosomal protein L25/general stress protein Ctc n=1 Tax=unclassified Roseateles TaxID=2626991 RepID=UPI0021E4F32F|nr:MULTISPECIES: 50S ribosomal protein L25/general stress protein Ctc [unclassified Roseateles]MCV2365726.1 50S ribosomal protein L25/general stress protein Ctc [Paucibacter sp. DJ1R-11]MCV2420158.1 50S ribosomal protein L25/general stress protein Ctc [Paucibacter sp. DJ4R-1]MCV2436915.1 50S ribosomal protein L25/general stress protein Ctc [Paucibacter sp. DJ2R-2]
MKFTAFERNLQGTGASRRLRIAGRVPGIVFGAGAPANIELDHNALFHALKKEAFHSTILEMELNGAVTQVLLRDFQLHPYKPQVLHCDFQRVDSSTKITKKIPLHFIGEDTSPAVKTDHCTVNHIITELQITCLAQQLPAFIEVDLSGLTKGHSVHVNDLKIPAGIKVVTHGKPNPVVATPVEPVVEVVVAAAAAPADDGKKKKKK